MFASHCRSPFAATLLIVGPLAFALGANQSREIPAGAEAAVKAALAARKGATLEEVATPPSAIGLGGPSDPLWTIKLRVDETVQTLHVSADGVLVKSSRPVEMKDLPSLVHTGVAKAAPKGVAHIRKLETLGVVRYVALPAPECSYFARVRAADSGTLDVTVAADGKIVDRHPADGPRKERKVDPKARTTDGPIPELAARAVAAMREVFPDMVFDLVEEVPYIDSSTQTISMVWYEVEFFVGGVKHEFNATPDGIVIAYRKPVAPPDLPKSVADALAKEVPGGTIEEVTKSETRAGPRIVALAEPVVVYEIEPKGDGDAKLDTIKLRLDGTEVKEPELPDWARPGAKGEARGAKADK